MPRRVTYNVSPEEVGAYVRDHSRLVILMPPMSEVLRWLETKRPDANERAGGTAASSVLKRIVGGGVEKLAFVAGYKSSGVDRVAEIDDIVPPPLLKKLLRSVGASGLTASLAAACDIEEIGLIRAELDGTTDKCAERTEAEKLAAVDIGKVAVPELLEHLGAVSAELQTRFDQS